MGLYFTLLVFFLAIGGNLLYLTFLAWTRPPRHAPPAPLTEYPRVTVQLPIYNELYVVERLIEAACRLEWPRERLEIQVLDDSTDETQFIAERLVQRYARQGIDIVHIWRSERIGFKAGALEAGVRSAHGEFLAIFDADFVPPPKFLLETIPYFQYERVGFVQARWGHLNRSYSLLTELQSVIIDAHFLVDQVARSRAGFFMNFNGTAGVWRRAAIVDAGGWEHDTLAEDLDLSYRAQLRGWEAVYLPDVVAYAELPVTVGSYRSQQRRWAAGSFACAIKLLPTVLRAPLPAMVKAQALLHMLGYVSHVSLLLMFLLQPFLLYFAQHIPIGAAPQQPGISWWFPLTLVPSMAPVIYLTYSQWRTGQRLASRLPYVACASVLGAGIMVTVVGAMLRVLSSKKQFVFERTPKYGIARPSDSWERKRYGLSADFVVLFELLLACYSVGNVAYAAMLKSWSSAFYTSYFLIGLLFILFTNFAQMSAPLLLRPLASTPSGNQEP
jgi:cellulose synthase/poly-beta-1,6-N-acetylglucosamine synthase-like glycosyltransferase